MRRLLTSGSVAAAILLVVLAGVFGLVYQGRPRLEGMVQAAGLQHPVTIKRDANGTPLIEADDLRSAMYALGFLHGQERYFQMDLQRRKAAGELSELFGRGTLAADQAARMHRFRARARGFVDALPAGQKDALRTYVAGVNEGLRQLAARPFEYLLLLAAPQPWSEDDSMLVNSAMYLLLQQRGLHPELAREQLLRQYGAEFADFIQGSRSEWDAPMQADRDLPPEGLPRLLLRQAPVAQGLPVRSASAAGAPDDAPGTTENVAGSNSWVVSGPRTADGRAILANDMHLPLQQPNTFYRVSIALAGRGGVMAGVTIPGLPLLVAGSNGSIAWGLTNANGDWSDLVRIPRDRLAAESRSVRETITVRWGAPAELDVQETRWGPIVRTEEQAALAMSWVAHHAEGNNLAFLSLLDEPSIDGAVRIAAHAGMAHMNILLADSRGHAAWTVAGRIPRRVGLTGAEPQAWGRGVGWDGWLDGAQHPVLAGADRDHLWTANNRVVSGDDWKKIGVASEFALGVRAGRIRDRIAAVERSTEQDMHRLQLDDTAPLMKRWHTLASGVVAGMAASPRQHELAEVLGAWNGRADAGSAAYRVVRRFRDEVAGQVMPLLLHDLLKQDPGLRWYTVAPNWETPLWAVVSQQPRALLPAGHASWPDYLGDVLLQQVYEPYKKRYGELAQARWGDANVLEIRHVLSASVPLAGRLLDLPGVAMHGDSHTVLAQSQSFGPAMRLVVSPGHEQDAILTMPAGEADNPLTPYYGRGHQEWQQGRPMPLLAGAPRYVLRLEPPPRGREPVPPATEPPR
jgi:penicillin amidase